MTSKIVNMEKRIDRIEDILERLAYERDSQVDITYSINERMIMLESIVQAQRSVINELLMHTGLLKEVKEAKIPKRPRNKLRASAGL